MSPGTLQCIARAVGLSPGLFVQETVVCWGRAFVDEVRCSTDQISEGIELDEFCAMETVESLSSLHLSQVGSRVSSPFA